MILAYSQVANEVFILVAECWKGSKQRITVDSTTETGYIGASEAAKEAVWIYKFITELGVVPSVAEPISFRCNDSG